MVESRQELKEKQAYLLHILDAERKAKLQYLQQTDELEAEIRKLKNEVSLASVNYAKKTRKKFFLNIKAMFIYLLDKFSTNYKPKTLMKTIEKQSNFFINLELISTGTRTLRSEL